MTIRYQLHPDVQAAYSDAHAWLGGRRDAAGYMDTGLGAVRLDCMGMKHIAAQFALYFHAHHFKTRYVLDEMLKQEQLEEWINHSPRITVIDVGCGAGAASAALTASLMDLRAANRAREDLTLVCIGVDPVANALGLYYQMMQGLKASAREHGIQLELRIVDRPVSESVTDLVLHLEGFLKDWGHPALSQVIIAQSNIVRPLAGPHRQAESRRKRMRDLGIPEGLLLEETRFGTREARSYLQLFRQLPIDNLHILTVGTNETQWIQRVKEMGESISEAFRPHIVEACGPRTPAVIYENPEGSYWKETLGKANAGQRSFVADVRSVGNTEKAGDAHWHRIITLDNLELAWARVRLLHLRDAVCDKVEIRIFERDLKVNLDRLRSKLSAYDGDAALTSDRIEHPFPKNEQSSRPFVLPRLEEDIISVAIVQVLGKFAFGLQRASYANRPSDSFPRSTEHLYQNWFDAFRRYKDDVWIGVKNEGKNCKVLQTDIKSYYTNIDQKMLVDAIPRELRTQSKRVKWLLERLFLVDLNSDFHRRGHGLAQGGAGSGFYANAFLAPVDSAFGLRDIRCYRYMWMTSA